MSINSNLYGKHPVTSREVIHSENGVDVYEVVSDTQWGFFHGIEVDGQFSGWHGYDFPAIVKSEGHAWMSTTRYWEGTLPRISKVYSVAEYEAAELVHLTEV